MTFPLVDLCMQHQAYIECTNADELWEQWIASAMEREQLHISLENHAQ